jgi:hypothetical protein
MSAMLFYEYFRAVNGKGVDFDGNYGVIQSQIKNVHDVDYKEAIYK